MNTEGRFHGDEGATMVEYALMVALIAVVCLGSVSLLGNVAQSKFSIVGSNIGSAS
jgi:pilus assembly protein Flp/PilA